MRMIPRPIAAGAAALALLAVGGGASRASAQQTYPQTLYWGVGLIDIPVAWIAPVSGDFAVSVSGQTFNSAQASPQLAALDGLNTNGSLALSFWGRLEVGFSIYSDNPEWGLFASGLVLNEEDYRAKSGADHWMPSISRSACGTSGRTRTWTATRSATSSSPARRAGRRSSTSPIRSTRTSRRR